MKNKSINKDKIKELKEINLSKRKNKFQRIQAKLTNKNNKNSQLHKKHLNFQKKSLQHKKKFIEKQIKRVELKYKNKITNVNKQINSYSKSTKNKEVEQFENGLFKKYFIYKTQIIDKRFNSKIKKIKYQQEIAKITNEQANIFINNIEIDRHLNHKINDQRLELTRNFLIKSNRLQSKKEQFEKLKKQEINSLLKQQRTLPAFNAFTKLKNDYENFKSLFIFNKEIRNIFSLLSSHLRRYSMVYIFGFVLFSFYIATNGQNVKPEQFINIIEGNTYILIIGLAMLMVIVGGYIDLSVGSLMGFLGAFSVVVFNRTGGNLILTLVATIALGSVVGVIQGVLIGYFKMPAFIVTLGGMLMFQGLILWLTESATITPQNKNYTEFVTGSIPDIIVGDFHIFSFLIIFLLGIIASIIMIIGRNKKAKYGIINDTIISFILKLLFIIAIFSVVAYSVAFSIFGLKYYIIYIMILAVVFLFIMQNTSFGRKIYAIGGNAKSAVLSGINRARTTVYIFVITGAMVGFASIVFTGVQTSAAPAVSGSGYELDVISSVFVGGASMSGGIGTVQGTIIGGLILGYINSGMILLNLGSDMQKIVKAIVLVTAVGYDIFSNRKIS